MIIQKLSTCSSTNRIPSGWTVFGPIGEIADEQVHVNIIHNEREVLNAQLERMYNEEFGDTNGTVEEGMSVEDHKANVIMDQSKTQVNGYYQIQLPSRDVIEVASNSKMDSNRRDVLLAFPVEERTPHIKDLDLKSDNLPLDKAL